ncbi:TnsD family transposase [Clostridium saccharoperbutylacetonicum]|uniref:TnsD family transposase n=1 Tax=Clostridium saccharoperbutylacetonicum TaxID=36745 RepID=UPI0039E8F7D5
MIAQFPVIYKDEILYSAISRYHIRSGNISPKATLLDLFGSSTLSAVVELPSNIDNLIKNMPVTCKYTSEELIYNHTLFPFYTAFLPPERVKLVFNSMRGEKGGDIYNRTGIMASSITQSRYFKYCPHCVKEGREKHGELFWHRVHQLSVSYICPKHKTLLLYSNVSIHQDNKHQYISANLENCAYEDIDFNNKVTSNTALQSGKYNYSDNVIEKLSDITRDIEALINIKYPNKELGWFQEQYINKLIYMGYANINGRVNQKDLLRSFIDYYSPELLNILQSDIDINSESNWLSMITRKHRKSFHPIRHLLLIRFLGLSLEEFFHIIYVEKPFGEKPWPCLNAGSEHYLKPVVADLKISYDSKSKKTIGTFTCDCGFIYKRSGPDVDNKDRYKIGRIEEFGDVWKDKLRELVNRKLSLRAIAKELKVDTNTVDKYAGILRLEKHWSKNKSNNSSQSEKDKNKEVKIEDIRFQYRSRWIELLNNNPNKSKTEIRNLDKSLFIWLYRNDREWLNNNSPTVQKRININRRVNWNKRDSEILKEVQKAVSSILKSTGKPERITVSSIGKKIDRLSLLEKHLDKMLQTKEFLHEYLESIEDFRVRRVRWAIKELERDGEELIEWRILRKAGIREEYFKDILGCIKIIDFDKL